MLISIMIMIITILARVDMHLSKVEFINSET